VTRARFIPGYRTMVGRRDPPTNTTLSLLGLVLVAAALVVASGCRKSGQPLARLERVQGTVERDHATRVGVFASARPREEFWAGDGIKTGVGAGAWLELMGGTALELESSTLMRFVASHLDRNREHLELELGQAVLTTGNTSLAIQTWFGAALVQPNTRLRLARSPSGGRIEVAFGSAILETQGQRRELTAGRKVQVGIDRAIIEAPVHSVPAAPASPLHAAPATEADGIQAEVDGDGARIRKPAQPEFEPLPRGTSIIAHGSTLRLAARTNALLRAPEGEFRFSGPGEYSIGGSNDSRVRIGYGGLQIGLTDQTTLVSVPGGTIRLSARSRVSLRAETGTKVEVGSGTATVEGSKASETLRGGEQVVLNRDGTIQRSRSRSLEHADFTVPIGESFIAHDPRPPCTVGFVLGKKCEALAVLELDGQRSKEVVGEQVINVRLGAGKHSYTLRCLAADGQASDAVARGWLVISADAGTRRLPTTAPASTVDTDGRNYTLLFQNRLPAVAVRWPKPPTIGPFVLLVKSPSGRSQSLTTSSPYYTFAPGKLGEGTHELVFEGGGSRTKPTLLELRFDNAAPAASIESPEDGSFSPGSEVLVAGAALPGSRVSVADQELAQDDQQRFSGSVRAPTTEAALAIRLHQPNRGNHYYLRRASGAAR
jgi:hypothetical protein